jgi:CRISPR-associated protein Cas1
MPALDARIDTRIAQYRLHDDSPRCLTVARDIVTAKIRHARRLVMRYQRNHPQVALQDTAAGLRQAMEKADRAQSPAALRGIEGAAARDYFSALRQMVCDEQFDGRSRRPPTDPANALLSLGYTLLGGELTGHLLAQGLDPYLGCYHVVRRGMPALAQDLLEEFRAPVVDRAVLAALNTGVFTRDDFCAGPRGGQRLLGDSLRRFLAWYEELLTRPFDRRDAEDTTIRHLLIQQAANFRRACVTPDNCYKPFHWDRD